MNDGPPITVAYADPPYLGMGRRLYGDHPEAAVYDRLSGHMALIERLTDEFPGGWAMSASSSSLRTLLPLCPADCRVGAWVKPFCSFNPAYTWEPVIWRGGRKPDRWSRKVRDHLSANVTLRTGFNGAKPEAFCFWVFDLLGLTPADTFVDLFPGSNAVTRAWGEWCRLTEGLFAGGPP
jgi:hypothetical protein